MQCTLLKYSHFPLVAAAAGGFLAFALARKVAGSYYPKNFTPEGNTNKGVAGQQSAAFMSDYEMAMAALARPKTTQNHPLPPNHPHMRLVCYA